jgi:acetylornithine deacetylase
VSPSTGTLQALQTLVGFATVSRDSNLGLIEWVRDRLARQGAACRLTYDAGRRKANLFATLGEGARPGLILSGHTDVVPVDGQDWRSDPFTATLRDGRLYGRGCADMKGFIAVALALAPRVLARAAPDAPVHLALSYDEEIGCVGVRGLIADLREQGLSAAGCIVGEPTGMEPVLGHKGARTWRCCVRGREAHSSLASAGVNAVENAALLIARLRELAGELARNEHRHDGFDVPHSTLQANWIQGGIATNVVPRDCEFRIDLRHLSGTDPEALLARLQAHAQDTLLPAMRAIAPESEIRFEALGEVPAFETAPDAPLVARVRRHLGAAADAAPRYVGFGSEAGLFQRAGIASVLCGPGSIEQAHKPDEFVSLEQLARCERFLESLLELPSAPPGH